MHGARNSARSKEIGRIMSRSMKQRSCEVDEPSSSVYIASRSFIAGEFSLNFKRCRANSNSCMLSLRIDTSDGVSIPTFPLFPRGINLSSLSCRCRCSCKSRLYKLIPRDVTVASQRITTGQYPPRPPRGSWRFISAPRAYPRQPEARGACKYAIMSRVMRPGFATMTNDVRKLNRRLDAVSKGNAGETRRAEKYPPAELSWRFNFPASFIYARLASIGRQAGMS